MKNTTYEPERPYNPEKEHKEAHEACEIDQVTT